jgi:hypothetical protein
MTDVANSADQNADAKPSIEETMAAVFDKAHATESAPPSSPSGDAGLPSVEQDSEPPASSPASGRLRGPDGKFVEKPKAEAAPQEAAPAPEISDQPQETKPDATAPTPPATAPVSWSQDAKAAWASLPVAVQQAIIKREQEASNGIKSYADKLKSSEPLQSVIAPRAQALAANYGSVENGIKSVLDIAEFAGNRPLEFLRWFVQQRGIDLNQLGQMQPTQTAPVDPQLAATQQRLGQLENLLISQQRAEQERQTAELNSRIEAFKSDPKNAHFEELRQDMAKLIQGGLASDLSDAYEKAMWANPQVRAKVIESQRAEEAATRDAEAKKKAADARKSATINVATKGTVGASPSTPKTHEQIMSEVYDRAMSAA